MQIANASFDQLSYSDLGNIFSGIGAIISAIISCVLFVIVIYQVYQTNKALKLTKEEMEIRLRPLIGVKKIELNDINKTESTMMVKFTYTNYGQSPAENLKIWMGICMNNNKPLNIKESMKDLQTSEFISILMPSQEIYSASYIPVSMIRDAISNDNVLYLGFNIEYLNPRTKEVCSYNNVLKYDINIRNFVFF